MKCVVCKGADISMKMVDEEIRSDSDIVLVQIQVLVCSSCGERYYDQKTMRKIEETRSRLRNRELEIKEIGKVFRAA